MQVQKQLNVTVTECRVVSVVFLRGLGWVGCGVAWCPVIMLSHGISWRLIFIGTNILWYVII